MATVGSASYASRELGQGWRVNPYLVLQPNTKTVLADVKGQGAIKHIWMTDSAAAGRLLILRIWFDGSENPAVEVPLSDFFCNADYLEYRQLSSLAMCVNPKRGLNCYFEMPYFKSFRIELENLSDKSFSCFTIILLDSAILTTYHAFSIPAIKSIMNFQSNIHHGNKTTDTDLPYSF